MESKKYLITKRPYGGLDLVISPTGKTGPVIEPFIKEIGDNALRGRTDITGLSFLNVTKVGNGVFAEMSGLRWVSMPNLVSVGNFFLRSAMCSTLYFPKLVSVEDNAFIDMPQLKKFDASMLARASNFFLYDCPNLEEINAPLLTTVGINAFGGCSKLSNINMPNIRSFSVSYPNSGGLTAVSSNPFPNIRTIGGDNLFANNSFLESIDFPVLQDINGSRTFLGCYNLETINIPICSHIGENTFGECPKLKTIYAPNLKSIDTYAFVRCSSLNIDFKNDVPFLEYIGLNAFVECSSISNISLPHVSYIGAGAFHYCQNLKGIADLNKCSYLDSWVFADTNIEGVILGSNAIGVHSSAFYDCPKFSYLEITNAETINFSSALTRMSWSLQTFIAPNLKLIYNDSYIPWSSFTKLSSIYTPKLYAIPPYFYGSNRWLSSTVDMPYTLRIGDCAFYGNSYIVSATFGSLASTETDEANLYGNMTKTVGANAFANCINLESITLYTDNIAVNAFDGCPKLKSINVPMLSSFYSTTFSTVSSMVTLSFSGINTFGPSLVYNQIINSMSTIEAPYCSSISAYAFQSCSNLLSVNFGRMSSGCTIGMYAFNSCFNLEKVLCNATTIGSYAFYNCSSLKTFVMERTSTSGCTLYNYAFTGCSRLESVALQGRVSFYGVGIFLGCEKLKTINLPDFTYNGFYYSDVFNGCNIENLWLGSNTSFIWMYSTGLSTLKTLSMPNCNSFSTSTSWIGKLSALKELTCNSLAGGTYFPAGYFSGNSTIEKINGVITSPNQYVCYNCTNLEAVTGVSGTVYSSAFYNCVKLSSISFENANVISTSAFMNCSSIQSVNAPILSTVGANAFANCAALSIVYAPRVNEVNGFANCSFLNTMVINFSNTNTISALTNDASLMSLYLIGNCLDYSEDTKVVRLPIANAFNNTPIVNSELTGSFGSIFVKASFVDAYKAHASWASYKDRIVGMTDEEIQVVLNQFV